MSVDGTAGTVNRVSVNGSELTLALAAAVTASDTVTVSYTDPTPGDDQAAVQDRAGNDAAGFIEQTVVNYVRPWVTAIERAVYFRGGPDGFSEVFTDEFELTQREFRLAVGFNQVVTGFEAGDLVVVNGTITEFDPSCFSETAYCVDIQPTGEDQATVTVEVPDDVVDGGNWGTVPYRDGDADKPGFASASARPVRATQWAGRLQVGPALTLQLTTAATAPVTGTFTVTFTFNQEVLHRPSMSGESAQYPPSQEFLAEDVEVTPGRVSVGAQVLTDDETVFTVSVDPPADFEGTLTVRVPARAAWNANGAANQEESLLDVQVDTLAPALIGAAVADTTLALRYREALDEESPPAPDAFTMIPSRTVSGVAVRGDTVTLTLAAAVPPGEPVTLTYAVPDTDPIRDVAGNAAAALSGREVAAGPAIDLVEITSDAGTDDTYAIGDVIEATVTLSEAVTVSGAPYLELDFGGQEARRADYAAGASTATALVFTYPVAVGDAAADGVAIGANRLQRNGGVIRNGLDVDAVLIHAEVAADPAHKVDGVGPTLTVAATTRDGAAIVLTFNEPLATATAGAGAFTVSVDGAARTVDGVSVNGSELTLALAAAVTASETATVSYADPTPGDDAHAVQDAFGNDAADLHAVPVVNYARPWVTAIERTVSQFGPFTDEFVLTQRKFELAIAFNQVVTGFDAGDLVVVNGTITEFSPCHSAIAYCVVIQPMVPMGEDQATVTVEVPADVVDGGNWGTVPYRDDDAKKPGFPSASARPGRATQWAGLLQVGSAPTLQLTIAASVPVTGPFTVKFTFDQPVLHRDAGESAIYPVEEYFDAHDVALTWSTGTGMPSGAVVTHDDTDTVFTATVDPPRGRRKTDRRATPPRPTRRSPATRRRRRRTSTHRNASPFKSRGPDGEPAPRSRDAAATPCAAGPWTRTIRLTSR